mmetsp:Transcript_37284/g.57193  ORF Transcript_37284/g.57193 Transcript_37284/m.57193 type:complete len:90 (-) Transcript_37284:583-852(-)
MKDTTGNLARFEKVESSLQVLPRLLSVHEKHLKVPTLKKMHTYGRIKKNEPPKNALVRQGTHLIDRSEKIRISLNEKQQAEEKKRQKEL